MRKKGYLLLAAGPLVVLILGVLLFEWTAPGADDAYTEAVHGLVKGEEPSARHVLVEVRARYIWLATAMLALCMPVATALLCGRIVWRNHRGPTLRNIVVLGVGIAAAVSVLLLITARDEGSALHRIVFGATYYTLDASGRFGAGFLGAVLAVVTAVNIVASLAPVVILIAFCSTVSPREARGREELDVLATRMRQLKEVLNAGSAMMVAGVVHMAAWLRWPAALVLDESNEQALSGVALAVSAFWGICYTLMLMSTYVPAATYLSRKAVELVRREHDEGRVDDPDKWLAEHGLSILPSRQIPQIAVMLAPVIAGPIGSFIMSSPTS